MSFEARVTAGRQAFVRGFEAFAGGAGTVPTFLLWLTRPAQNTGDIIEAGETDSNPFVVIKTGDYSLDDHLWGIGGDEETIYFAHNDDALFSPSPLINNLSPISFAVLREVPGPESKFGGGIGGNAATVWYSLFTNAPRRQKQYQLDPSDLSVIDSADKSLGQGDIGGDSTVLYATALESSRWILFKQAPGFIVLMTRIDTTTFALGFAVGGDADRAFFYRADIVNDSIVEFDTTTLANIQFLQSGTNIVSLGGQT